jgi:hypothetical protein
MTKSQIMLIIVLVVLNVVVMAGVAFVFVSMQVEGERVAATRTAVAAIPTALPTGTPTPPAAPTGTPTLVMGEAKPTSAASGAILAAMDKGRTAKSYRIDIGMSMKGDLGQLTAGGAKNQEVSLLSMTGEVNGENSHLTLKGIIGVMLSGNPDKGIEMIDISGKSYVRGPVPLLGAKDNRWYVLQAAQAASTKSKLGSADIYGNFLGKQQDFASLSSASQESLDGKKCDVYSASKQDAMNAFLGLGATPDISREDWSLIEKNVQSSEYKVWVCDDGYLHQVRINIEAQDSTQPGQIFGMKLLLHAYDFGGNLKITAPANAIPAVSPFIVTPTVEGSN